MATRSTNLKPAVICPYFRVTFNSNNASNDGGAIYTFGPAVISEITFTSNSSAGDGGAIMGFDRANVTITTSTFTSNSAAGDGGAIKFDAKSLGVFQSSFENNSEPKAARPPMMIPKPTLPTAPSTTIPHQTLAAEYTTPWTQSISETIPSQATAQSAAGASTATSDLKLFNNIIANSTSGNDCYNDGANLIGNTNLIETGNCSGDITDDPMLGTLQDNGGPTETMAPAYGSPAVDAGAMRSAPMRQFLVSTSGAKSVPPTAIGTMWILAIWALTKLRIQRDPNDFGDQFTTLLQWIATGCRIVGVSCRHGQQRAV